MGDWGNWREILSIEFSVLFQSNSLVILLEKSELCWCTERDTEMFTYLKAL